MPRIEKYCMVGARGWDHPAWGQGYYPDDMPSEWQPQFYAHEFGAVLLPMQWWLQNRESDVEENLAEIHDECRLLFDLDLSADPQQRIVVRERLQHWSQFIDGVVIHTEKTVINLEEALQQWVSVLGDSVSISIDAPGNVSDVVECLSPTLMGRLRPVWHDDSSTSWGAATVGVVHGQSEWSPRQLRELLDRFLHQAPAECDELSLIFVGEPPSIPLMRQTQVLLELMGVG